jgi:hypothetical protein
MDKSMPDADPVDEWHDVDVVGGRGVVYDDIDRRCADFIDADAVVVVVGVRVWVWVEGIFCIEYLMSIYHD